MAAVDPASQPSPEEQQRQQAAAVRGEPLPGRGGGGTSEYRADDDPTIESAMGGADDANSGGGNASGIPDGETAIRAGAPVTRGDVQQDREKVFPDSDPSRHGAEPDRARQD